MFGAREFGALVSRDRSVAVLHNRGDGSNRMSWRRFDLQQQKIPTFTLAMLHAQ